MDDIKDQMNAGLGAINDRLDRMPTSELLTVHLQAWEQQLLLVRSDVKRVENSATKEIQKVVQDAEKGRRVLHEKVDGQQRDATAAKRWAISAAIAGGGAILGFVTLILTVAEGGVA
jgi:hypothetical protein